MSLIEYLVKFDVRIPGPQDVVNYYFKRLQQAQSRAEIAQLLEAEDWILRDMGIDRNDIRAALAQSDDPGEYLERCRFRTINEEKRVR